MNVTRYNAKDCSIVVGGVYITGLGEDMVSIEKEEALAENSVGAQGDVVRSEINNSIYTITVTVQSTSPQFPYLLSLKDATEAFPIWVINKPLKLRAGGTMAFITEMPSLSLGSEAEDVEFSFSVYDGDIIVD
jgi:hypothetical protein